MPFVCDGLGVAPRDIGPPEAPTRMRIDDAGLRSICRGLPKGSPVSFTDVNRLIRSAMDGKGLSTTEKADLQRILSSNQVSGFGKTALEMYVNHQATYRASLNHEAGYATLWKAQGQGAGGWFMVDSGGVQAIDALQASRLMKLGQGRVDPALTP